MDIVLWIAWIALMIGQIVLRHAIGASEKRIKANFRESLLLVDDRLRKRIENRVGNPPEVAPRQAVDSWLKEVCGE